MQTDSSSHHPTPSGLDSEKEHKRSLERMMSEGGPPAPSSGQASPAPETKDAEPVKSTPPDLPLESAERKGSLGEAFTGGAKKIFGGLMQAGRGNGSHEAVDRPKSPEKSGSADKDDTEEDPQLRTMETASEDQPGFEKKSESPKENETASPPRQERASPPASPASQSEGKSREENEQEKSSNSAASADQRLSVESSGAPSPVSADEPKDESPPKEELPPKEEPTKSQSIKDTIPSLPIPEVAKSPDLHARGDSPQAFERKAFNMFASAPSPSEPLLSPVKSPRTSHSPKRMMVDKPRGAERFRLRDAGKKWEDLGLEKMPWHLLEGQHFFELEYPSRKNKYFRKLPNAVSREKPTDEPMAPPSPLAHPLFPR